MNLQRMFHHSVYCATVTCLVLAAGPSASARPGSICPRLAPIDLCPDGRGLPIFQNGCLVRYDCEEEVVPSVTEKIWQDAFNPDSTPDMFIQAAMRHQEAGEFDLTATSLGYFEFHPEEWKSHQHAFTYKKPSTVVLKQILTNAVFAREKFNFQDNSWLLQKGRLLADLMDTYESMDQHDYREGQTLIDRFRIYADLFAERFPGFHQKSPEYQKARLDEASALSPLQTDQPRSIVHAMELGIIARNISKQMNPGQKLATATLDWMRNAYQEIWNIGTKLKASTFYVLQFKDHLAAFFETALSGQEFSSEDSEGVISQFLTFDASRLTIGNSLLVNNAGRDTKTSTSDITQGWLNFWQWVDKNHERLGLGIILASAPEHKADPTRPLQHSTAALAISTRDTLRDLEAMSRLFFDAKQPLAQSFAHCNSRWEGCRAVSMLYAPMAESIFETLVDMSKDKKNLQNCYNPSTLSGQWNPSCSHYGFAGLMQDSALLGLVMTQHLGTLAYRDILGNLLAPYLDSYSTNNFRRSNSLYPKAYTVEPKDSLNPLVNNLYLQSKGSVAQGFLCFMLNYSVTTDELGFIDWQKTPDAQRLSRGQYFLSRLFAMDNPQDTLSSQHAHFFNLWQTAKDSQFTSCGSEKDDATEELYAAFSSAYFDNVKNEGKDALLLDIGGASDGLVGVELQK